MTRHSLFAILLCVLFFIPSSLRSETVGVLDVTGVAVPPAALERFETALVTGLEGADFRVRPRSALVAKLRNSRYVDGCHFGPCLRHAEAATGLHFFVILRVQQAGSSYTFVASLVNARHSNLVAQVTSSCPACSIDDAELSASMLGSDLMLGRTTGVNAAPSQPARPRAKRSRSPGLRVAGYLFLGGAVVAGAVGTYLLVQDRESAAPVLSGAGVGLVGSAVMLGFSRTF